MSSIPIFQTLISVEKFREIIHQHFEKLEQINEDEEYDQRDIQRFNEIDEYTLMYIQHEQSGSSFNEERAFRIFHESMSWRKKYNVYDISPNDFPGNYFDKNTIYFENHDMNNNPLFHFVVRTFHKGQEDNEAVKRFITYNFERHVRHYPGQKIVILFDLNETGLRNLDYDLIKFIISCVRVYYPGLLAYILVYKMPLILRAAWRIIRSWLPSEAEQFIKFVDATSITRFVRTDQLSLSMGGTSTTNYVHIYDLINDGAVEDPINASLENKITFIDTESLDVSPSSSSTKLQVTNDNILTPKETMKSLSTFDLSQSPILQKHDLVNGSIVDRKVYHGLQIKPHDKMIFEKSDSSLHNTTDCIQTLTLTNVAEKILTYKIKTTSPDKFRVKLACSILHPGASMTVSVYLLKDYCTSTSDINREKLLILWSLIDQELKQTELFYFWKNTSDSILYKHKLKCAFSDRLWSDIPMNQSNECISTWPTMSSDSSIMEMQKILKDSLTVQRITITQTTNEFRRIQNLLLIIFAFLIFNLLWNVFTHFSSSLSMKTDV